MFPLWLKLAYTGYVAVLVPAYLRQYGPGNLLWFSDVALILGLVAMWLHRPLLASTQAVAVLVPDSLWTMVFLMRVTTGLRLVNIDYMFDASIPQLVRALSLFHVWLPFLLIWMVFRLGYDRRALGLQVGLGTVLLIATYVLTPPENNVNWVHRWGNLRGPWPIFLSIVVFPIGFYLPAHLLLRATMPAPQRRATAAAAPPRIST
jgi:hypothetical protein